MWWSEDIQEAQEKVLASNVRSRSANYCWSFLETHIKLQGNKWFPLLFPLLALFQTGALCRGSSIGCVLKKKIWRSSGKKIWYSASVWVFVVFFLCWRGRGKGVVGCFLFCFGFCLVWQNSESLQLGNCVVCCFILKEFKY